MQRVPGATVTANVLLVLDAILQELDAGRRAALCVVVTTHGSTPQVPGAMACVDEAGRLTGTVGGGATEAAVTRRARGALSAGTGGLFKFNLDGDHGSGNGAMCGGKMDVAIMVYSAPSQGRALREVLDQLRAGGPAALPIRVATEGGPVEYRLNLEAAPKLVIAGAGHVGRALAAAVVPLGFQISVIDDRREFANAERFPPPIRAVVGDISTTLANWPIDANTYVVIVTRGHKHDEHALEAVVNSRAKYLGMIGSRKKIPTVFGNLQRRGIARERLDRVHAPIGLAIKAVTPQEIAVSIAAELISIRRDDYRRAVEGPL